MVRILVILSLILGGIAAMALEQAPIDQDYSQSGRDQAVKEIMRLLKKGDEAGARRVFEQAHEAYGKPQAQQAPRPAQSFPAPMQLPPEAR